MSVNRHLSRIIGMQTLFEWDFRRDENIQNILARNVNIYPEDIDREYVINIVDGVKLNFDDINHRIEDVAPEFPLEQISMIDKAILRVAIFEMLYSDEVPPKVAINEAVELGKTFGGENSYKFINGVLGTVYRKSDKYKNLKENELSSIKEIND